MLPIGLRRDKIGGGRMKKNHIMVCGSTGCISSSSLRIIEKFNDGLRKRGLENEVEVTKTGCFGLCAAGPVVVVYPQGCFYSHVKLEDIDRIIDEHVVENKVVKELLHRDSLDENGDIRAYEEMPFYKKQNRIALKNCGKIAAEDIDSYVENDGYKALEKAIFNMEPQQVVDEIKESGLRGRGGGGFFTGTKWQLTKDAVSDIKYVVCNADEGDPGAFMDRSILEADPHSVIEAMAIAGYATGASKGYVYIRAEYSVAIKRLETAIRQSRDKAYLGSEIRGSGFSFDIEIRLGSGAFVCGEETALINSIEGKRGMPRPRPPFPALNGIWKKPTLLNNVETFSNIAKIVLNGAKWFASIGTENSKGSKVFALGGKINNVGLVEIPMGTSLREIIFEIGGGIPNGKKFKAVQIGGPSGGCIPSEFLDTEIDYESLCGLGSIMGSGGMIVMDEDDCMVDIARFFMQFMVDESCGKCTPCREGTKRMLEILNGITGGNSKSKDIDKLERLAHIVKNTSLCGLGQTAPNPVLSTLRYFRDEYISHVEEGRCPARKCKDLLKYNISERCVGCTKCAKECPVSAISGKVRERHEIDMAKCIKCGICMETCPFDAIEIV